MAPRGSPPCPSPSSCKFPAPTGSTLQRQHCTGRPHEALLIPSSHLAATPAIFHSPPHNTSAHFSVTPPKPASICRVPPLTSRPQLLARSQSPRCTPRSRTLSLPPPSQTSRPPFSSLAPVHLSLTLFPVPLPVVTRPPSPNGSSHGTRSKPRSPARPPPSRRWCGCCSWKGTVALSGCSPARGEPARAGGEQPRRSPPAPPRPGPQAPPPLPPAAAPAIARPAASPPWPHNESHTAPQPPLRLLICPTGRRPAPATQDSHWPMDPQIPPPNQSTARSSLPRR